MPERPRRGASRAGRGNRSARKGLNPRLRPPEYQGVYIVRALVGVHHLEVYHVAHHAELVRDAVAAQHVAREARDLQRLAAGVALHDRGDLGRVGAFVFHAPEAQHALQSQAYFRLHVGELLLDELVRGERPAELLAVEHVLAGAVPAILGRAERAPGDSVTRRVQAGERAFQAFDAREQALFRNEHLVHHDFAGDRGAQTHFAVDRRRRQSFRAFFCEEAADASVLGLRPDEEEIGDGRVADPGLGAREAVAARDFRGARLA